MSEKERGGLVITIGASMIAFTLLGFVLGDLHSYPAMFLSWGMAAVCCYSGAGIVRKSEPRDL